MAKQALNGMFHRLRTLAAVQTGRSTGDRELLRRFVGLQDEAAFTVLVERHGPMVLGLCRRLLRHGHDADDACQATFLVLARKAGSLRKQESLGSWLHGIAYRICMNLKRQAVRRVVRERSAPARTAQEPGDDLTWRELRTVLDEELQRLPERYRAPLVLCYLEGRTRDEAAQQLGTTAGALHGRLERGRNLLRDQLTRRGLTLSAALLGTALTATATHAALAAQAVVASVKAAVALSQGLALTEGLIAPHVLSLAKEASKVMFTTKLKIGAALFVAAGMLTTLAGESLHSVSLAQDAAGAKPKPAAAQASKQESDEEFIRRISKDLRGVEPTPTEIHFFASSGDANRRQRVIDLFIQERQAKEKAQVEARQLRYATLSLARVHTLHVQDLQRTLLAVETQNRLLVRIQHELYKELAATKEKKEVAKITQKYLDQLLEYVKAHPKNDDVPEAMLHISLVYRSQGKSVEADAWRDKLKKEHPQSPAAKTAQGPAATTGQFWTILPDLDARIGDDPRKLNLQGSTPADGIWLDLGYDLRPNFHIDPAVNRPAATSDGPDKKK